MKEKSIDVSQLAALWQASPVCNKIHFALLLTRLAWRHADRRQRACIMSWYANLVIPPGAAALLLVHSLENPVALIASTFALALCVTR